MKKAPMKKSNSSTKTASVGTHSAKSVKSEKSPKTLKSAKIEKSIKKAPPAKKLAVKVKTSSKVVPVKAASSRAAPLAKKAVATKKAVLTKKPVAVKKTANKVPVNKVPAKKVIELSKPTRVLPKAGASGTTRKSAPPASVPLVPKHSPDAAKASYLAIKERAISPAPYVAGRKDPKLANAWKTKPAHELTDEEVKAMPDDAYMNEKQLAFFKHKLTLLKQNIHNNAGETTEHLREDSVIVPDPTDRATIEEEHALELRKRDRERKLLAKIEQSLASIESGEYGFCLETNEPIGVGRLIARPTANLSLEAQQRRELKQKMFGD